MAYFTSIWKARIIEKCRQEYENEKINSLLTSKTEIPQKTIMQRWRFYGQNTKRRMTGHLKKWFPDGSSVSNLYFYLKSDHALPRFVLKSLIGFVCGIVLTYLCFIFFVFQLSISLIHATIMSSIIGVLLTLGLAFSCRIRCLIFLLIPQLFSRVGRYTLTCYALVLILTGPATNTLRNSEVLTGSMACSQEQIKTNVRHITETVKKPFNAMKESIKLMVGGIKRVTSKMKKIISKISLMVTSIADLIQSSYSWLNYVANVCHQKFGTPYDHCLKSIDRGTKNYIKSLGNDYFWLSNNSVANSACLPVKSYKTICIVSDYATTSFAATLKRRLREYITRINTTFFVNAQIQHIYSYSSNESSTSSLMAAGIVTEIRKRADPLLTWLSWSSCITSLFLLLIIFRAKYYQHMFETRSRYDNRYVTKELRDLDFKRYQERRETVLPLNRREQAKYICISSFRLVSSERVYLTRSIIFMAITTFKLLIHMVADYSLYWVLITIRHHGRSQTPLSPGPSDAGVHVSGSGIVGDFIRSILDSIASPLLPQRSITVNCLPNPYPPDLQRYVQIAILIILLWFFALFEPYGLRFRHVIVGHYQPDRAKTRAVWLYNHILRTRGSFMKLARRKLHREYKYSKHENQTFRYWLNSILPCWHLRYMFGTLPTEPHCLLCKTFEELNDSDTKLTNCDKLNCPGVYCIRCFSDIGRMCTVCLSPKDYGDMSDISLEKGSSDESDIDGDLESKQKGTEMERLIKKPKSEKVNSWEIKSEKKNEQAILPDIEDYEDVTERNVSHNSSITNTNDVNGYGAIEKHKVTEHEQPIQKNITRQYDNKSKFDEEGDCKASIDSPKYNDHLRNEKTCKQVKKLKAKRYYRTFLRRKSKVRVHEKHPVLRNMIYQYLRRSQALGRIIFSNNIKAQAKTINVCKVTFQTRIAKYLKLRHKLRNNKSKGRKSKLTLNPNENNKYQKYAKGFTQSGYYIAINKNNVSNPNGSRNNKNTKKSCDEGENCKERNIRSSRQNINVFLSTCSNYYRNFKSISSSRKLYNIRNNDIAVFSNKINFKRKKTTIKTAVNDKTKINNNPINKICSYLLDNTWFKVKDRNEKERKSKNKSKLKNRGTEDKYKNTVINQVHAARIPTTPESKLNGPLDLNTCEKTSEKPKMVYKDDNELDIAKEFGDPVNDYNNEINATCVTLSSLSLSYDTKSDTNTYSAEDYQESPKPLRAMRRKRKVKIYSRASSETSTHLTVSDMNAIKNDWWSPILERNLKGYSRKIRVD